MWGGVNLKKIYVLDTSVLLEDPNALFAFEDNEVIIPTIVLEEIDHKKRLGDEIGRNARYVSRVLDDLREKGAKLQKGVKLDNGGTLRIELNHRHFERVRKYFNEATNDNRILAVALNLLNEHKENNERVILVSKDVLVRVKANAIGIKAQDYLSGKIIKNDEVYEGYETLLLDTNKIDNFYKNGYITVTEEPFNDMFIYPHKFFILKDNLGTSKSAIAWYNPDTSRLENLNLSETDIWGIKYRNVQQKMAIELLLNDNIPLVTITGRAGTGKTLLALAAGLYKTEELGLYKKLLVARPIVPMGKELGYLPGDKNEKLRPWIQPIYDNMEFIFGAHKGDIEDIMVGLKKVEVEALTFIRGRTIPNQFIIIDEAQNLTKHEVKTIVSRVGEGSKIVLVGDPEQIDHPYLDSSSNGLTYLVEKFKDYKEGGHVSLIKGERSRLAQLAAEIL